MYKILIVEDDPGIAGAMAEQIRNWSMEVTCARDFRHITAEFAACAPHLILLDIALPYMNGYYWCGEIRKVSQVPIIFISSAADNLNIVMAMNMGGDDFIAKPFDASVLIAKIQALLRRTYHFAGSASIWEHRGAMLNADDGTFVYDGNQIPLSKNEYRILLVLMKHKGKAVSREMLMEALWQTDAFVDENALTVNVGRLRKKLDAAGLPNFIETKFGVGYEIC